MLTSLTINNIILIERLHIDFEGGLCVLSGETGAGKSILMDCLGLVVGGRRGRELIRPGSDQASVTAEFHLPVNHGIWTLLGQRGLSAATGEQLLLRRSLTREGRSRAYVNDQPVSVSLLREIGDMLVEIHGQHDERGLLNPAGHRKLLDNYGQYDELQAHVRRCHEILGDLVGQLSMERDKLAQARADEDYVRHNLAELTLLSPQSGEERQLADARRRMMQGETMSGGIKDILAGLLDNDGVETTLRTLIHRLARMTPQDKTVLEPIEDCLDRAASETMEAISLLEDALSNLQFTPEALENTEERLFSLRAAARKHHCQVDDLADILIDFDRKCHALDYGNEEVRRLEKAVDAARKIFHQAVEKLTAIRTKTAGQLDKLVNSELPPLRMEKAHFITCLLPLERREWGAEGGERVEFRISTNPGAPFGGLIKVASAGELSRFILALKVVLARKTTIATLVFDEIDRGVGGAVADAVGVRLQRLSTEAQILVITHSPQVAARADHHWLIEKSEKTRGRDVFTTIISLDRDDRKEEIARMLAGAKITDEARAAAQSLLQP